MRRSEDYFKCISEEVIGHRVEFLFLEFCSVACDEKERVFCAVMPRSMAPVLVVC